jgi:O-antigen ligase
MGKGGTAHSEYLLLLSESGIFSFLVFTFLVILAIYYGLKNYAIEKNKK